MIINQTKDYSIFKSIVGNRTINYSKIEKICIDVNSGFNMLPYCPVICTEINGKLSIIDGQHRVEVSKQTGQPVYYVVCNNLSLRQIAQLNSRGQKWGVMDFLNCYTKLGIEDYIELKAIIAIHKMTIGTVVSLLMGFDTKKRFKEEFEGGDFKVNFLKETEYILTLTNDLFGQYTFSKDRNLIDALQSLKNKGLCDFDKLKLKISQNPIGMDKQATPKNYIYNIERVYNFKNHSREVIY
jgi:hypothetical protein